MARVFFWLAFECHLKGGPKTLFRSNTPPAKKKEGVFPSGCPCKKHSTTQRETWPRPESGEELPGAAGAAPGPGLRLPGAAGLRRRRAETAEVSETGLGLGMFGTQNGRGVLICLGVFLLGLMLLFVCFLAFVVFWWGGVFIVKQIKRALKEVWGCLQGQSPKLLSFWFKPQRQTHLGVSLLGVPLFVFQGV